MRRSLSVFLALALLAGTVPSTAAVSWEEAVKRSEAAGLKITWYPEYESLTRLYGSERMLLQKDGLYGLFGLDGTEYTGCIFDAVDFPSDDGTMLAMQRGKWGKIDQNGRVLVDFLYTEKEEANDPIQVQIIQKGGMFAVADGEGRLLTGYDYWNAKGFVNGYAAVQNTEGLWGYLDGTGELVIPCRFYADAAGVGDFGEDGLAIIQTVGGSRTQVINTKGDSLFPDGFQKVWRAGQGMLGFLGENYRIGFADGEGNIVVEPQYAWYTDPKGYLYGSTFDENGVAEVYIEPSEGGRIWIDTTGGVLDDYPADDESEEDEEGLYMTEQVPYVGPWGFQNAAGELVVPYFYDGVGRFEFGVASVRAGGIYGLLETPVDRAETEPTAPGAAGYVTEGQYDSTETVMEGRLAQLAVNWLEKIVGIVKQVMTRMDGASKG